VEPKNIYQLNLVPIKNKDFKNPKTKGGEEHD
jgi:hypothetical protein